MYKSMINNSSNKNYANMNSNLTNNNSENIEQDWNKLGSTEVLPRKVRRSFCRGGYWKRGVGIFSNTTEGKGVPERMGWSTHGRFSPIFTIDLKIITP